MSMKTVWFASLAAMNGWTALERWKSAMGGTVDFGPWGWLSLATFVACAAIAVAETLSRRRRP